MTARSLSGSRRLYFTYFAALGAVLPFQVLFLQKRGLSPTEIGLVATASAGCAVIPGLLWTAWSDRRDRRRPFLLLGFVAQSVLWLLYPLARNFLHFLLLSVVISISVPPIEALMNVVVLGLLDREMFGRGYASVRVWGSIGWIFSAVAAGALVERTDLWLAFILGSGLTVLCILQGSRYTERGSKRVDGTGAKRTLSFGRTLPFGVATATRALGVGMTYTFLSVYLAAIGTPFWLIGWGWAFAAMPEIPIMVFAGRLSDKFGRMPLLALGSICSSIMPLSYTFVKAPAIAVPLMALSGVSFALFYTASVGFLADVTPADRQATAQALLMILTSQLPRIAGPFLGGLLIDRWGLSTMFLAASMLSLLASGILIGSIGREGMLRGNHK